MRKLLTFVLDRPVVTIIIISAMTFLLMTQMKRAHRETDLHTFLPDTHPDILYNNKVEDMFGVKSDVVVGILNDGPDGIFNPASLEKVKRITERLEMMKGVLSDDVVSLANQDNIIGTEEGLEASPFMEEVPQDREGIEALKKAIFGNEMFAGVLVSEDGKATSIFARLEDGVDKYAMYRKIKDMADAEKGGGDELYISGRPILEGALGIEMNRDMKRMMPIVTGMVVLVLFLCLGSLRGVVLPVAVVAFSVIWSIGFMGLFRTPMYLISTVTPVILMAIGVADGIHIISRYYDGLLLNPDREKKRLVMEAMEEMWPPVVMTSLTTAVGFLSFVPSHMLPFRFFGIYTAVGVLAAMLFSLTLIPAGLVLLPARPGIFHRRKGAVGDLTAASTFSRFFTRLGRGIEGRRSGVIAWAVALITLSVVGIVRIEADSSLIAYFSPRDDIVKADKVLNEKFMGTTPLNVVIEGKEPGVMKGPEMLKRIDRLQAYAQEAEPIGDTISVAEYVKRINKVMNADDPAYLKVPDSRELIAQYLFLYSLSGDPDEFDDVVDYDYQRANVRIFSKMDNTAFLGSYIPKIKDYAARLFEGSDVEIGLAGAANVRRVIIDEIIRGQISSLFIAIVAVFVITAIMFGSVSAGFYNIVPISVATVMSFGVMGFTGTSLNPSTALVSSIGIGIGVDYAIHFISKYRRMMRATGDDAAESLRQTMATSGKAIFFNALVVIAGFIVLAFSYFPPNRDMGYLISLNMSCALLGAMTLLPALLSRLKPNFVRSDEKGRGALR